MGNNYENSTGRRARSKHVDDVLAVASPGPHTIARSRNILLAATGARNKAEWPSGANITYLTVIATTIQGTGTTHLDEKVIITIDAANDTEADGNLGATGAVPPASSSADAQFITIPLNVPVSIPLTAALSSGSLGGGRVDARAIGGTAIDLWIGAN